MRLFKRCRTHYHVYDDYAFVDSMKSFLLELNNNYEIKKLKCDKHGTKINKV